LSRSVQDVPSWEQIRIEFVERLRLRRMEWEEAVITYAFSSVPDPVSEGDARFVFGEREVVSACLDCSLLAIEYGGEWSGPIPPAVILQERRAVRNGICVTARVDRYLAAYQRAWDFVLTEAQYSDVPGGHKALLLREASMAASTLLAGLLREVVDVHFGELRRGAQTHAQRMAELVLSILAGKPVDVRELDYDFDVEHVGVIATGEGAEKELELAAKRLGHSLLAVRQDDGTIWAWLGGLPGALVADIQRRLRHSGDVAAVISRPAVGIAGFRRTHRLAQAALRVARCRPERITLYDDVELVAHALQDDACASSMIETYITPLDGDHQGSELRQTLKAFFEAGLNEGKAGTLLGKHRHTVERRLDKVGKLIGRPLYECYSAVEVALMLAELRDHPGKHSESPWP
jgi:hypothetical protein